MFALPGRAGRREDPAGTGGEEAAMDRELIATGRN